VASTQRDAAAQRLAGAVTAGEDAKQKLQTLVQYRGEYEQRLSHVAGTGIDANALRNYQGFLANLDRAIDQQRHVVLRAERETHNARLFWTALHRRTESFQVLDDRHVEEQATITRRHEQKQADDWVVQAKHRREFAR
jgi:flagellar FliJ protein